MKKFLKLIFRLVLVFALTLSLTACSKDDNKGNDNTQDGGQTDGGKDTDDTGDTTLKRDVAASEAGLSNMLGSGKLYVTTFGQADRAYLKEMIDEVTDSGAQLAYTYDEQLQASDVEEGSLVIAVVGYTSKGIAADITQTGEIARAKAFAHKSGITLVVVQLSGSSRRGSSSDPIAEAATSGAALTLICDDGKGKGADYDGKYSTEWCKGKALYAFSDEWNMTEYFKVILGL